MTWKGAEYSPLPLEARDLQKCSSSQKPPLSKRVLEIPGGNQIEISCGGGRYHREPLGDLVLSGVAARGETAPLGAYQLALSLR